MLRAFVMIDCSTSRTCIVDVIMVLCRSRLTAQGIDAPTFTDHLQRVVYKVIGDLVVLSVGIGAPTPAYRYTSVGYIIDAITCDQRIFTVSDPDTSSICIHLPDLVNHIMLNGVPTRHLISIGRSKIGYFSKLYPIGGNVG